MTKSCQTLAIITFFSTFISFNAYAIELRFPVACQLMKNCWVTRHVDLNKRSGSVEDYMCGQKTIDGAKSTHISLANKLSAEQNVPVVASYAGKITTARNVGGFCGVRIVIEHEGGWESSYCHLNPRTINVQEGQHVRTGQALGTIGMSGQSNWPHLSYALLRNGMVFDPFSGKTALEGCSLDSQTLWSGGINPLYEPAQVTNIGFNFGAIKSNEILNGTIKNATVMRADTPHIALWAMITNVRKGDNIVMKIVEPSGRILEQSDFIANNDHEHYPIYLSKFRQKFTWEDGQYKGVVTLSRPVRGYNKITVGKYTTVQLLHDD